MNILQLKHFFVVDTETTGFSPSISDIIEVSALEVVKAYGKFFVVDTFDMYVNPGYPLPPAIVAFNEKNNTGICDEFLSDKPSSDVVAKKLEKFLGKSPDLVGHNLPFDIKFVNKLYAENLGYPLEYSSSIDTLSICRNKMTGSHKLCDVHAKTKGTHSKNNLLYHNSLSDCFATLDVLEYLIDKYYTKGIER